MLSLAPGKRVEIILVFKKKLKCYQKRLDSFLVTFPKRNCKQGMLIYKYVTGVCVNICITAIKISIIVLPVLRVKQIK